MPYISLALTLKGEESLLKFYLSDPDPDLQQNLMSLSLSNTQHAHQISSGSVHNFLRYPAHRQTNEKTLKA